VDDEHRILEGLERMLFHMSDDWEMSFEEGGASALETMKTSEFDVIVTDMRMPGMDGSVLLGEVSKLYPNVVRIVLSGYAEMELALRAVPVAHQFLTKPCDADLLVEVVERACALQNLLSDDMVRSIIGNIKNLPSVPSVYMALNQTLADINSSADDVARIVNQDPAMSAKVLQLVNSAFFGRSVRLTSITQAVVRLGFQMVKNLVLSMEIFDESTLSDKTSEFSISSLQQHSVRTAAIARSLFDDRHLGDDAFMAGMLHDIGQLLMASEMPDRYKAALNLVQAEEISLQDAEVKLYGVSHAEVGAYLLGLWGLPYQVVEAVANHHHPKWVRQESGFGVLAAVYLADCFDNGRDIDMEYLDLFEEAENLEEWHNLAEKYK
jgi:putative nucleotidyltransferase with HDIG domain